MNVLQKRIIFLFLSVTNLNKYALAFYRLLVIEVSLHP